MLLTNFGRKVARGATAALALTALVGTASAQYSLVWADEFDGTSLDLSKWEPQIGNGCPNLCGWGNNELQYYRAENATVGGGQLTITARRQNFGGNQYTSARLRTRNLADFRYGRFEMRAKMPIGQGLWPAFWMLPTDSVYGTWAASGEIDIMEYLGHDPDRVYATLHFGGSFPNNTSAGSSYNLPSGNFNDGFHDFAIEWDEQEMRWFVDGVQYRTTSNWWSSAGAYPAPFNQNFHLLLNLAVGGDWPGAPDATTQFPQTLEVDYVRVYERLDLSDCTEVFDDMEHGDPFANGYFLSNGSLGSGSMNADSSTVPPLNGGSEALYTGWGGAPNAYLGSFGRNKPTDLTDATHFKMWIRPEANENYTLEINLQDDDNGDNAIAQVPDGADDEFQYVVEIGPSTSPITAGGGWQLLSIPLSDFVDDSSYHFGGNGVFDPTPASAGGNGQLINVVITVINGSGVVASFRTDQWVFTEDAAELSGRLFNDLNGDGQSLGEPGLAGVALELYDIDLQASVAEATSMADGSYVFPSIQGGSFEVRVDESTLPSDLFASADPDGVGTPNRTLIQGLGCGETISALDFGYEPVLLGSNICSPAVLNSLGFSGRITATGSPSAGDNDVTLLGSSLPPGSLGYFLTSQNSGFIPQPGGSLGNLCLLPPFGRYIQFAGPVSAAGTVTLPLDLTSVPQPTSSVAVSPGSTWYFQFWHRDGVLGFPTSNFTDALGITFL